MKTISIICLLLHSGIVIAQQSMVKGIVSIHNSETRTGKRQYVTNAEIDDDFGKATPRLTDDQGRFILMYVGIPDKASVSFQVKKKGLQVVDQTALSAVAGQDALVKISMAYPDSINEYRRQIFQVGKTEAEKRLETLVENNAKELATLRKNEARNADRIKAVEAELARLGEQSKRIAEQAETLARKYAPLNLDDAPRLFRTAFNLFQKGYFDSAYGLLQQANLDGKVDAIVAERKKLTSIRQELVQRDATVGLNTDDARQALQLKADFHKTRYEPDSAGHCYEQLLRLDSANGKYLYEYADFFCVENNYPQGLLYAGKALAAYRQPGKANKDENETGIANTLSLLALLYSKSGSYAKAEAAYQEALTAARRLPKKQEDVMAAVYHNQGTLYSNKKEFARSEAAYGEALKIYTRLAKKDAATYRPEIAYTQAGLGILYRFKGDFTKAEATYAGLLQVYEQLTRKNQQLYEPLLATMYEQLGITYVANNSFASADTAFQEALRIRRKEVAANPQVYRASLAAVLNELGDLYSTTNDFARSEIFLSEALTNYRQLALSNPQAYQLMVADSHRYLAILYSKKQDVAKAAAAYDSALIIYRQLVREYPQVYESGLSLTLYNQGVFARTFGDFPKAETALLEALEINSRRAKADAKLYLPQVALAQAGLGDVYKAMTSYVKARTLLEAAVKTYEQLVQTEPKAYNPYLTNTQGKLADACKLTSDTAKAVAMYLTTLAGYEPLVAASPQAYGPEQANTKAGLGSLYIDMRQYDKAESLLKAALAFNEKAMVSAPQVYTRRFLVAAEYLVAAEECMPATPQVQTSIKALNDKLTGLAKNKKIAALQLATYYGNVSWYLCLAGRFAEAEPYARRGIAADRTQTWIKINLAHSLLFQGKPDEAVKLYKELRDTKREEGSYAADCFADLTLLEKKGFTNKDINAAKAVLKK